jgi:hypothetical protein
VNIRKGLNEREAPVYKYGFVERMLKGFRAWYDRAMSPPLATRRRARAPVMFGWARARVSVAACRVGSTPTHAATSSPAVRAPLVAAGFCTR